MSANAPPEVQRLAEASHGLLYPSESDEPFEVLYWETNPRLGITAGDQLKAHAAGDRTIEQVDPAKFFGELARSWTPQQAARFHQALESILNGLTIFRVGSGGVEVDIYLLGQTQSKQWAGLHTVAVET